MVTYHCKLLVSRDCEMGVSLVANAHFTISVVKQHAKV